MAVFNLGSINIDHIFRLPHLPQPGETLQSNDYQCGLGGKGANQSLALAMAGAEVFHIGRMAANDAHYVESLTAAGVDLRHTRSDSNTSGSAIVMVDEASGENQIILNPSCNHQISTAQIDQALAQASTNDWALTQNETNNTAYFLNAAKAQGLKICYSAAPFVAATVIELLPLTDLLVVNEIEAQSLASALNCAVAEIPVPHLLITLGAAGARYIGRDGDWQLPSPKVQAIDTTGAGDTFLGYALAALTQQQSMHDAVQMALHAAALQVTRKGTAQAIPSLSEVQEFMASTGA